MSKELLEGEADVHGMILTQRGWASEVLAQVAEATDHGSYPQNISMFDLGRALGRAIINSNESADWQNLEAELFRGLLHYREAKEGR